MKPLPHCVVLSVMYRNEGTVEDLLASLAVEAELISEVILVDNGSGDRSADIAETALRRLNLPGRVVRSTNTGFAGGYETARRAISTDGVILCVNPDVSLAPGTIAALLEATSFPHVAIATAPLRNLQGEEDTASRRRLPTLGGATMYAILGRLLPARLRYNSLDRQALKRGPQLSDGSPTTAVEATTGALMMLSPSFRNRGTTIFDLDYWMYGEDLQLCLDAARSGKSVLMVERDASTHVKGASSGLPRSRTSDRAFHDALFTYYAKNLQRNRAERAAVRLAVKVRFLVSRAQSGIATRRSA